MAKSIEIYDVVPNILSRSTQPSSIGITLPLEADDSIDWKRGELIFRSEDTLSSELTFANTYTTDAILVGILVNDINYTASVAEERQIDVYVAGWFLGPVIFELQSEDTKVWLSTEASEKGLSSPYSQALNNTIILEVGT